MQVFFRKYVREIIIAVIAAVIAAFILKLGIFADPQKVIIVATPEIPENSLLFKEDFEDEKTQLLIPNNGGERMLVREAPGNIVYQIDNTSNNSYADITFGDTSWTDYAIQLQIKLISVEGIAGIVHFRESLDHENGYILGLMKDEQAVVLAYKKKGGTDWYRLETASFSFEEGRWYDVYISVVGSNIRIYLDNFLLMDENNPLIRNGFISMSTGPGNVIQIDNINVYAY